MAKSKRMKNEELLSHARSLFQTSVNFRASKVSEQWRKDNDQYNSLFETDKQSTIVRGKKLFIGKTYANVQRLLIDVLDTFFFDPEEIVDIVHGRTKSREEAQVVKAVVNHRLNSNPVNAYFEAYEASLDALKNKVGIWKVWPELHTDDDGEITKYIPHIDCLPYEDVFFDPCATWKDYWKYPIMVRSLKTKSELRKTGYKNVDAISNVSNPSAGDDIKEQRVVNQGSPFFNPNTLMGQDKLYVYEFYDFQKIDGKEECVIYHALGDTSGPMVIGRDMQKNELPFTHKVPIVVGQALPEPHQMYGKSHPEIWSDSQRETNAIVNNMREASALAIRRHLLVARGARLDLNSLNNRRIGGVTLGDDISDQAVRELNQSDPTNSLLMQRQRVEQDFFLESSLSPNVLGVQSSKDETATGVTSNLNNANKRIQHIIRNLAHTLFIPGFKMFLQMEQEYETDEYIENITGEKLGWQFSKDGSPPIEAIRGSFDLTVNVAMNKQLQLNRIFALMDRGNQYNATMMQMLSAGVINPAEAKFFNITKAFSDALPLLGRKNVNEYMMQGMKPPVQQTEPKGIASQPQQQDERAFAESVINEVI